jgi:hypothetical protein
VFSACGLLSTAIFGNIYFIIFSSKVIF